MNLTVPGAAHTSGTATIHPTNRLQTSQTNGWDPLMCGLNPWSVASTSAAAAASAIEAAAYFASGGQQFPGSGGYPTDFGLGFFFGKIQMNFSYPWHHQWSAADSRWQSRIFSYNCVWDFAERPI